MFAKADKNQLAGVFKYLDGCLEQIVKDNELGALKQALKVPTHTAATPSIQPLSSHAEEALHTALHDLCWSSCMRAREVRLGMLRKCLA